MTKEFCDKCEKETTTPQRFIVATPQKYFEEKFSMPRMTLCTDCAKELLKALIEFGFAKIVGTPEQNMK